MVVIAHSDGAGREYELFEDLVDSVAGWFVEVQHLAFVDAGEF